jgi:hypothetical protein
LDRSFNINAITNNELDGNYRCAHLFLSSMGASLYCARARRAAAEAQERQQLFAADLL